MKMTQLTLVIILGSKQLRSLIQNKRETKSGAWHTELLKLAQNRFPKQIPSHVKTYIDIIPPMLYGVFMENPRYYMNRTTSKHIL